MVCVRPDMIHQAGLLANPAQITTVLQSYRFRIGEYFAAHRHSLPAQLEQMPCPSNRFTTIQEHPSSHARESVQPQLTHFASMNPSREQLSARRANFRYSARDGP